MNLAIELGYEESVVMANGPKAAEIKSEIQEDFARADIYYQTLNVQSIIQSAKYSVQKLFYSFFCSFNRYF